MNENTHSLSHFFLLSSLVDLAYLLQNQLQESTRLKLLCGGRVGVYVCVCKGVQCFHRFTAFVKIRSARAK